MKKNIEVEGKRKGEDKEKNRRRVEYAALHIAHKWRTTVNAGVPEGDLAVVEALAEKILHGIEKTLNIPEKKCLRSGKYRMKKERQENGAKQGRPHMLPNVFPHE